jgi:hypothetical protein
MECGACEKHFWSETSEEVSGLFNLCETFHQGQNGFCEDIKSAMSPSKSNYDKRKLEEWDLLCCMCPERNFHLNLEGFFRARAKGL